MLDRRVLGLHLKDELFSTNKTKVSKVYLVDRFQ